MARFHGSLRGQACTEATRCGSAESGITGHIRGWNVGARVEIVAIGDQDFVRIYRTNGSNGYTEKLIAEFHS